MPRVTPSSTVGSANSVGREARRPAPAAADPRPLAATASAMCRSNLAAVASLFSGPMVVAGSNGSPSLTSSLVAATTRSMNSARTAACDQEPLARGAALARRTGTRPPAPRRRPAPGRRPPASPSARCRPARAAGPCPPPGWRPSRRSPPSPTKPTPATPGWPASASPTTGPGPGTKLNTPAGRLRRDDLGQHGAARGGGRGGHPDHGVAAPPARARTSPRPSCTASSTG